MVIHSKLATVTATYSFFMFDVLTMLISVSLSHPRGGETKKKKKIRRDAQSSDHCSSGPVELSVPLSTSLPPPSSTMLSRIAVRAAVAPTTTASVRHAARTAVTVRSMSGASQTSGRQQQQQQVRPTTCRAQ
jgi:hypothetical protein